LTVLFLKARAAGPWVVADGCVGKRPTRAYTRADSEGQRHSRGLWPPAPAEAARKIPSRGRPTLRYAPQGRVIGGEIYYDQLIVLVQPVT
jgi:hypothetical protein